MTVASKPVTSVSFKNQRRQIIPVIPFERADPPKLEKGDYTVMKCKTDPGNPNSATFDLPIPYFRNERPEVYLKWRNNLKKVIKGQAATDGPTKYLLTRQLLEGDALTVFNLRATARGNETNEHYKFVMADLTQHVFPLKALQTQKRYMRRFLRKPKDTKVRDFVSRVSELNQLLIQFPGADENSKLPDDELLDLLEFGVPSSWQRQMILQDFDPVFNTVAKFVDFCERQELIEPKEDKKKDSAKSDKNSSSKKRKSSGGGGKGDFLLHGDNCGHSTHDCRTLKAQASKLKEHYKKKSQDKSKEAHVFLQEAMMAMMKKNRKNRKKKDSEEELQNFESLSIDSDDSIEKSENPFDPSDSDESVTSSKSS